MHCNNDITFIEEDIISLFPSSLLHRFQKNVADSIFFIACGFELR